MVGRAVAAEVAEAAVAAVRAAGTVVEAARAEEEPEVVTERAR